MPKQTDTWLEPLLTRELRRVKMPPAAPPRPQAGRAGSMWFVFASAGALMLASATGLHAYLTNAPPLSGQRTAKAVRFQAWVQASTGLDIHGACRLCHAEDELRAGVSRGVY
jgi:uncharacterized membrane protein